MGKTRDEIRAAENEEGVIRRTHIGGQALIEGIMMRGKFNWAVGIRCPDGSIYTEEHDLASGKKKNSWMYWPIIRGCTSFVESLVLSFKALSIATTHAYDEKGESYLSKLEAKEAQRIEELPQEERTQEEQKKLEKYQKALKKEEEYIEKQKKKAQRKGETYDPEEDTVEIGATEMTISMVLGVVLGVGIFIVVPAVVTNLICGDYGKGTFVWNLVDGILRIIVFVGYIWLISLMKDIKRMFAYHGSEHKTIHAYERGLDLCVENSRIQPRLHVRCGTAFLLMTCLIAILVYCIFPTNTIITAMGIDGGILKLVMVILIRILLLPLVAGVAYEITVKWAGTRPENSLVKIVLWPGLQLQRLTTKEPTDDILEVAIAATELILAREEKELGAAAHESSSCCG